MVIQPRRRSASPEHRRGGRDLEVQVYVHVCIRFAAVVRAADGPAAGQGSLRHSPPHSRDERCQPPCGSATDSRRTLSRPLFPSHRLAARAGEHRPRQPSRMYGRCDPGHGLSRASPRRDRLRIPLHSLLTCRLCASRRGAAARHLRVLVRRAAEKEGARPEVTTQTSPVSHSTSWRYRSGGQTTPFPFSRRIR